MVVTSKGKGPLRGQIYECFDKWALSPLLLTLGKLFGHQKNGLALSYMMVTKKNTLQLFGMLPFKNEKEVSLN